MPGKQKRIQWEKELLEIPMGVSQWKNYGKKFGYWEYFEKDFISKKELQEVLEDMKQKVECHDNKGKGICEMCQTANYELDLVIQKLCK